MGGRDKNIEREFDGTIWATIAVVPFGVGDARTMVTRRNGIVWRGIAMVPVVVGDARI